MINFPLIGLAAGLVLCAFVVKVFKRKPEKASKSDKAQIMKQLLAKADQDNTISSNKPAPRSRAPLPQSKPSARPPQIKPSASVPRPTPQQTVPAIHPSK